MSFCSASLLQISHINSVFITTKDAAQHSTTFRIDTNEDEGVSKRVAVNEPMAYKPGEQIDLIVPPLAVHQSSESGHDEVRRVKTHLE